ncbi:IS110 family transposase [Dongia sp.]|uniref:IS110 family transposase n=1 Tax=Dongia sp. TaxID=1977262 RepID=UPI00375117D3
MEKLIRIGMDTSKGVFQLHGVNAAEQPVLKRQLRRREVEAFFAKLEPTVVAIEACGGSHYWARTLEELGHQVKLLAPQHVKPYVKRGKNDKADAAALCEAVSRPDMKFVAAKNVEEQAALMWAGMRARLIKTRTQLSNAIRSYAGEFGLVAAKGLDKIEPLLTRIAQDEAVPLAAREAFALHGREYAQLQAEIREVEAKLMAWHRGNQDSRNLAEVPGIGPIGGTKLAMKKPDAMGCRSGRYFSAWLGLTAKDHSTAGRQRLGGITRAGDPALRSVLVVGAMAVIRQAERNPEKASPWLLAMLKRKPKKLVAVALANKNARIAWKMMMTGERYDPKRAATVLAAAA